MSASRRSARCATISRRGNLTALRELALRRTAERVDDQMLSYMREHAITGPWAAGERVIVCLDPAPPPPMRCAPPSALPTGSRPT